MPELSRYSIPKELMQAIVNSLNAQPAGQVRAILNAIESEVMSQEKAAAEPKVPQIDTAKPKR